MRNKTTARERDYSKEPNRFTLKMLYNGDLIVTTDRNGNQRKAVRDFDYQFREPRFLGDNPLNDKVNQRLGQLRKQLRAKGISEDNAEGLKFEIDWLKNQVVVQDEHNNPHKWERNLFENSWEAVEMGDRLIEIFRLKLRDGTEDYISMSRKLNKPPNLEPQKNYYTLVLMDNQSIRRDENGQTVNVRGIMNQIDSLNSKAEFDEASGEELRKLESLKKELKSSRMSREIFRCDFSADDFSYDGKDFTPPLSLVWKDFNVYFKSPAWGADKNKMEFSDVDNYNNIINTLSNFKRQRSQILEALEEASELRDNIKTRVIEKSLESVNEEISYRENIYFKGLRSCIKQYLNREYYENRFLKPVERYNNFHMNSSENEITKACWATD